MAPEKQQRTINAIARVGGHRGRFDAWNSSSTGHQVAETRPGTGWRESRNLKLRSQFKAGLGGGERVQDTAGDGAGDYDERLRMVVPKEIRRRAERSVVDMLVRPGEMRKEMGDGEGEKVVDEKEEEEEEEKKAARRPSALEQRAITQRRREKQSRAQPLSTPAPPPASTSCQVQTQPPTVFRLPLQLQPQPLTPTQPSVPTFSQSQCNTLYPGVLLPPSTSSVTSQSAPTPPTPPPKGIFANLVIYVNGSTHPIISDHKLKQLLSEQGAVVSLHLARRRVTHVILGRTTKLGGGAGGRLAGGKIEKEIRRVAGNGVRYVSVDWILESVKEGKRLPEARFAGVKKEQQSVYAMFSMATTM